MLFSILDLLLVIFVFYISSSHLETSCSERNPLLGSHPGKAYGGIFEKPLLLWQACLLVLNSLVHGSYQRRRRPKSPRFRSMQSDQQPDRMLLHGESVTAIHFFRVRKNSREGQFELVPWAKGISLRSSSSTSFACLGVRLCTATCH